MPGGVGRSVPAAFELSLRRGAVADTELVGAVADADLRLAGSLAARISVAP